MSMEPQIQYARTDDGVSIAYATTGDGPPLRRSRIRNLWSRPPIS